LFNRCSNTDRLVKTDRIEIKKKRLHIRGVGPSDNGVYRCSANNTAGTRYSDINFALAVAGANLTGVSGIYVTFIVAQVIKLR
jgi:hypothetical protein